MTIAVAAVAIACWLALYLAKYGVTGLMDRIGAYWFTWRDCITFRRHQRVEMRRFRRERLAEYRATLAVPAEAQRVVEVD